MVNTEHEWIRSLQLSSIPLRQLDGSSMPIGFASGCLIDYLGKRLILSVFHATGRDTTWAIPIKFERSKGTEIYWPRLFNYVGEMTLGVPEIKEVDFSFAEVANDLVSYFQELTMRGEILFEAPRKIFAPSFDVMPSKDETYGFSGETMHEMHGSHTLATEHLICPGLKYVETKNGYHVFKLPVDHPGHKYLKGCSGAPIIDTKDNIVALVCRGDISENTITGVSLNKYKFALDVTYSGLLKVK